MSAGDVDFLLNLWAASLAADGQTPPFKNHAELYQTIDSTPLGEVPWESFTLTYNGTLPANESNIPSWMTTEYEFWFRDPHKLVQNMVSNPNFKDEFDYSPFHDYDQDGTHRFCDLMSGNWAWRQAVNFSVLYLPV